jgi:hypothetical protein
MPKSPLELKRFALYKIKLQKRNNNLEPENRLTPEQIVRRANRAVELGVVNDHGNIIERAPWDLDQTKR